jgi:alkanesulfonate monooxygenase SsuD/methylene tetrahydromethanopterin reductase-like flavin-dependent oxidoreductase (luciferase family)
VEGEPGVLTAACEPGGVVTRRAQVRLVAPDEVTAPEHAAGYGPWGRSIKVGEGAVEYPSTAQARSLLWIDEDRAFVADQLDTHFVGSPPQVADQLERLRAVVGADELIVTTITDHRSARIRSFEWLAQEWSRR